MSRYKAFVIHLLGSVVVLASVLTFCQQVWYPMGLFSTTSGVELLILMACVDVVVGPTMTLIVFDAKKKYIKLDMAIILMLQTAFLGYGLFATGSTRPVYVAFVENRLYLVKADEVETQDLAVARNPEFNRLPLLQPRWVGTKEPEDIKIRNDIVIASIGGMGIQNLPQYFVPWSDVAGAIRVSAKTLAQLKLDGETKLRIQDWEENHRGLHCVYVPLITKKKILVVAFDAATMRIIAII